MSETDVSSQSIFLSSAFGGVTAFWASPRFGHPHSQIPSVLGIPFSYYCSVLGIPRYPLGDAQIPSVLVIPSKKVLDFAGKSKTFQRWLPLNIEICSSILKRRLIRKALQGKKKTTLRNFAKKMEYNSKLESLFYVAKEKLRRIVITKEEKARVFEECHSAPFS